MERSEFEKLAAQWTAGTGGLSSTTQIERHPAGQAIIAAGQAVVPYLLTELRKQPSVRWLTALYRITGAQPVPEEDYGRIYKMAEHWLVWAEKNGIIGA